MEPIFIIFMLIIIAIIIFSALQVYSDKMQLYVVSIFIVLFAMYLVVAIPKNCCASQKEGFEDNTTLGSTTCPYKTKSYIDILGNTNCCDGQVNGSICDGKVKCTFSSSANNKYPICGKSRRRKWFGPIDEWVKQFMNDHMVQKFEQVLHFMSLMVNKVEQLDRRYIKNETIQQIKDLFTEEKSWHEEIQKEEDVNDPLPFQEEIMYIINKMITLYRNQPIDQMYFTQQFQQEVCGKK